MNGEEVLEELKVGMVFNSKEETFTYYSEYAKQKGFGLIWRSSKRGDDGNPKYFALACSKTRKRQSIGKDLFKPQLSTKTGCKAIMRFKMRDDGKFEVTTVQLDHDHLLSPGKVRHFRFYVYEVAEDVMVGDDRKYVIFTVNFNEAECEVSCKCCLFEFRGILCRHALSVLIIRKVKVIPAKYILARWRKDLKRGYTFIKISYNPLSEQTQRYEKMCQEFCEVATLAVDVKEKYELVMNGIQKLKDKVINVEPICDQPNLASPFHSKACGDHEKVIDVRKKVMSPLVTRGKGRPPTKRKVSTLEKVVKSLRGKQKKQAK
ncbi:hypothetical protein REPUB_Repub16aG0054500 [Reevesia pubescens]